MVSNKTKQLIYNLIIKAREFPDSYRTATIDKFCFYFYDGTIIKLNKNESDAFVKITYLLVSRFGTNKKIENDELYEFIMQQKI